MASTRPAAPADDGGGGGAAALSDGFRVDCIRRCVCAQWGEIERARLPANIQFSGASERNENCMVRECLNPCAGFAGRTSQQHNNNNNNAIISGAACGAGPDGVV